MVHIFYIKELIYWWLIFDPYVKFVAGLVVLFSGVCTVFVSRLQDTRQEGQAASVSTEPAQKKIEVALARQHNEILRANNR